MPEMSVFRLIKGEEVTSERRRFEVGRVTTFPPGHRTKGTWWWAREVRQEPELDPRTQRLGAATEAADKQAGTLTLGHEVEDIPLGAVVRWARDLVNAERTRRLQAGFIYDEGGPMEVVIEHRHQQDYEVLDQLKDMADDMIAGGDTTTTFTYRGAGDVDRAFTAPQWVTALQAMCQAKAAVYAWSHGIKDAVEAAAAAEGAPGVIAVLEAQDPPLPGASLPG